MRAEGQSSPYRHVGSRRSSSHPSLGTRACRDRCHCWSSHKMHSRSRESTHCDNSRIARIFFSTSSKQTLPPGGGLFPEHQVAARALAGPHVQLSNAGSTSALFFFEFVSLQTAAD